MKQRINRLTIILLIGIIGSCLVGEIARADMSGRGAALQYTVKIADPATQQVSVIVRLSNLGKDIGAVSWVMMEGFAFVRLPEPVIAEPITAETGDHVVELKRINAYEWESPAPSAGEIILQYTVPHTHRTLEAVRQHDQYEYPYLASDHGLLVTPTLFLYPKNLEPETIQVDFELPDGWNALAPWPSTGLRSFQPRNMHELRFDLIPVGHWNLQEVSVGDFQAIVAVAPGQETLEITAFKMIRQLIEYELRMFDCKRPGRYLFVFGRPDTIGMAGSPKMNSMTLSIEPRLVSTVAGGLSHLIAHEFFHTWMTGLEISDEMRWYNEGFTDYFAYLIPARLGLGTEQSFIDTLGEKMASCMDNSQRGKMSLVEAGGDIFFTDRDAEALVYDGGLLLAAWLDQAIRKHDPKHKLDDLMRAFNNDPSWQKGSEHPTLAAFLTRVAEFAGEPVARQFEQYVKSPYNFDPIVAFKELGIEIQYDEKPDLSLRVNLDGTRVTDIDPNSAAFKVGLRAEDRILKIDDQDVTDSDVLRKTWSNSQNGRIHVLLQRGEQKITIDQPIQNKKVYHLPSGIWD